MVVLRLISIGESLRNLGEVGGNGNNHSITCCEISQKI